MGPNTAEQVASSVAVQQPMPASLWCTVLHYHETKYCRMGSIISCCAAANANCSMVHSPALPWDVQHHQLLHSNAAISGFVKSIIRFHTQVDTLQ